MVSNSKVIAIGEYEEIPLSVLETKIGKRGINLLRRINLRSGCEIFQLLYDRMKATQFVGFVRVLNHTIQVVPKIFGDDKPSNLHFLLGLLRYTRKIQVKEHELGNLGKIKEDFFEILVYLFAKTLRDLLRKDFKKTYVIYEDNGCFLKGKLLIGQHVRHNAVDNTRYYCRFSDYTENNLMNQLFKYVASKMIRISGSVSNKKLLEDILVYLCDVDLVRINCADLDRLHFTRLNRAYEPVVNLCRLFLENMSTQFASSKLETFVFMFDMNRLFEEFVFEFIKRNRRKLLINGVDEITYVKDQFYIGKLFDEFKMKGDILINDSSGRKTLLDTKYKILDPSSRHGKLSQADFYQMFAYSSSQIEKYKNIILFYPEPEGSTFSFNRDYLTHNIGGNLSVRIYIRTIRLCKIFDKSVLKLNENELISVLNNDVFRFS
jgi:5-methylcytosine-specific restriction enzyme subunit McrC